jgi:hypothetical protein
MGLITDVLTIDSMVAKNPIYDRSNRGGYLFDGVNDYVTVADNDNLDFGTGDFSINIKITTGLLNTAQDLLYKRSGTTYYFLRIGSDNKIIFQINGGTTAVVSSTIALALNKQYTIIAMRISGVIKLYINGADVSSSVVTNAENINNSGSIVIGHDYSTTGNKFKGEISQVRLFNRALSASEVLSYYNNGEGKELEWADRGASNTDLLNGWDFTSGWSTISATINNSTTFTMTGNGGSIRRAGFTTTGKKYRVRYYGTTTGAVVGLYDYGGVIQYQNLSSTILAGSFGAEFVITTGMGGFLLGGGANGTSITVTTFEVTPIGNVAEYLPTQATASTWYDNSGNALNGTTSGSPILLTNNTFGNLVVKGTATLPASTSLTTPILGVASATSLALGGATLGTHGLANEGTTYLKGNVGIGTTNPNSQLEVSKTAGAGVISLRRNQSVLTSQDVIGSILFSSNDSNLNGSTFPWDIAKIDVISSASSVGAVGTDMRFFTNYDYLTTATEKMRIDRTGNVFINYTSDPTSGNKFAVNGNSYFAGAGTFTNTLTVTRATSTLRSVIENTQVSGKANLGLWVAGANNDVELSNDGTGNFQILKNDGNVNFSMEQTGNATLV